MRIEVVDEEKEGLLGMPVEPIEGRARCDLRDPRELILPWYEVVDEVESLHGAEALAEKENVADGGRRVTGGLEFFSYRFLFYFYTLFSLLHSSYSSSRFVSPFQELFPLLLPSSSHLSPFLQFSFSLLLLVALILFFLFIRACCRMFIEPIFTSPFYFVPVLPAFLRICSSTYLMPLPL